MFLKQENASNQRKQEDVISYLCQDSSCFLSSSLHANVFAFPWVFALFVFLWCFLLSIMLIEAKSISQVMLSLIAWGIEKSQDREVEKANILEWAQDCAEIPIVLFIICVGICHLFNFFKPIQ